MVCGILLQCLIVVVIMFACCSLVALDLVEQMIGDQGAFVVCVCWRSVFHQKNMLGNESSNQIFLTCAIEHGASSIDDPV